MLLEELEERSEQADQLVGVLTLTFSVVLYGATAALSARRYAAHASRMGAATANGDADMDAEIEAMLPRTRWSLGRSQA
mgnify:CR=1 FL=1